MDSAPAVASSAPVAADASASRARFSSVIAAYGEDTFARIQSSKLLIVGAGGIGCELLKNLVLTGFHHLTVLDLDTIDVSNLNRQFLFRRVHVGQSKALVAAAAVGAMVSEESAADLRPLHDNIKAAQYDHDFFAGFDLVMNALDNLEARRHVNRLCLSAGRTLLESGTQGYAGQTTAIVGGETECFECQTIPSAKTFAVCTIRNTPDKPVHTIVWAKSVYAALFGPDDEGNIMADARMDMEEAVAQERAVADSSAATSASATLAERFSPFARSVFNKLFHDEILKQCEVTERWKDRKPPTPLQLDQLIASLTSAVAGSSSAAAASPSIPSPLTSAYFRQRDQSVFSTAENALFLLHTIRCILLERTAELGNLSFDKDDELSMDFVSAAANLRMENFGIGTLSRFHAKGIAGNIVHAIATTNAIAAGLMVVDAIKLLQGRRDQCHTTWITRRGPALLTAQKLNKPNPACFVCAHQTQELMLDTSKWNLKKLFQTVLRNKLSMNEPGIDVLNRENFVGTEEDHEDNPDYLVQPLNSPGVRIDHGALLSVEDQSQKLSVQLRIVHRTEWNEEETPELFILGMGKPKNEAAAAAVDAAAAANKGAEEVAATTATAAATEAASSAAMEIVSDAAPAAPAASPAAAAAAMDVSESTTPAVAASAAPIIASGGAPAAAVAAAPSSLKRKHDSIVAPSAADSADVIDDLDAPPKKLKQEEEAKSSVEGGHEVIELD